MLTNVFNEWSLRYRNMINRVEGGLIPAPLTTVRTVRYMAVPLSITSQIGLLTLGYSNSRGFCVERGRRQADSISCVCSPFEGFTG